MFLKIFLLIILLKISICEIQNSQNSTINAKETKNCPLISLADCCTEKWNPECAPNHCLTQVIQKCPERKTLLLRELSNNNTSFNKTISHNSLRRSPQKIEEVKF